ncbi:TetR/AcrR family transcriptional regulator [Saccharopolyspora phatthalungensis]|uniref:AcrR family transcriptional regulator n=1 Tax=Saccharopolyspora phatthalungensis TaxID=664693 RepID=A0A840Q0R4_9PSEU|nr:TetR/AcrR family transcriptional regulator [Saccharopolyspora phatthalungensis]MBB5156122.1 AcrR family transcriptional regulator [Saccharopolyspora phatthalungensis]
MPNTKTGNARRKRAGTRQEARDDILKMATKEFADKGYAGARIDDIARRTQTTKKMIYYYFGDKEGLYRAVLERSIASIRDEEQRVHVDDLDPVNALRRVIELTFDYHERDPDFVRLMAGENILRAEHLQKSGVREELASPALSLLSEIVERGLRAGVFRQGIDAVDLHFAITSFSFFRVSNQFTFQSLFQSNPAAPGNRERLRKLLSDLVIGYVTKNPDPAQRL